MTLELSLDFNEDIRIETPLGIAVDGDTDLIAEFVVDNEFNPDQTKELVKSVEIRNAHETQAKGFGRSPGECLAFKMWRDVQEVQRWQGIDAVMELVEKGKRYAENELAYHQAVNDLVENAFIPNIENPEVKELFEAGLRIFKVHEGHAEVMVESLN